MTGEIYAIAQSTLALNLEDLGVMMMLEVLSPPGWLSPPLPSCPRLLCYQKNK